MKKSSFVALLLVGATVLGATVLREPIAWAAQVVDAQIVAPLDANGNVKVHEQGTANVNVSGGTVNLGSTPRATATRSGGDSCSPGPCFASTPVFPLIVSTIVLTALDAPVSFTFRSGGSQVLSVDVAADTTMAIPLYDRIRVDLVQDSCDTACDMRFSLLGQEAR